MAIPADAQREDLILLFETRPGQNRREAVTQSQGSAHSADGPVAGAGMAKLSLEGTLVKANLARFTFALALLASMALSLGAGMRWD
jgi:hypothetical protein